MLKIFKQYPKFKTCLKFFSTDDVVKMEPPDSDASPPAALSLKRDCSHVVDGEDGIIPKRPALATQSSFSTSNIHGLTYLPPVSVPPHVSVPIVPPASVHTDKNRWTINTASFVARSFHGTEEDPIVLD